MSINDKFGRNRAKFRRVYGYGLNRRPDIREFVDALTDTTRSLNFQQIIRDRNYFVINGDRVVSYPTGSTVQYSEESYHTTGSVTSLNITFPFSFNQQPLVAIRLYPEWVQSSGSNVAYWITNLSVTGFSANFSAPYEGELVYRAVYTDETFPVYVQQPSGSYVWISAASASYNEETTVTMSFATLSSVPTEVFSNPIGDISEWTLNLAQSYASVGTNYTTINFSAPYSGSMNIIALATDPSGSPQPVDPY